MSDAFHVRAAWSVQGGAATAARVEVWQEIGGALVQVSTERLVSKVDLSLPGLRRALRRARLATGGTR